jgi:hypothetical protein
MTAAEVIPVNPMDDWDLPVAAYNILKREGVYDIDKLIQLTEAEIIELRGFLNRPIAREGLLRELHRHNYQLARYIEYKDVLIPGLRQGYQATRDGRIFSPKGKQLKPTIDKGKPRISVVMEDGNATSLLLATMVLSAFIGYMDNSVPVHIDGNLHNCYIDNLKWQEIPKKRPGRPKMDRKIGTWVNGLPEITPTTEWPAENWDYDRNQPLTSEPAKRKTPGGGKVETYRMYVSDDVTASISDDGTGSIKVGSTTVSLTAHQLRSLVLVAGRIGEVNSLMGIG